MSGHPYAEMIDEHYGRIWGSPSAAIRWSRGPIAELPDDFRILVLDRSTDTVAFATRCMSQPEDKAPLELHALCRPEDAERSHLVEILTSLAHYHRTGNALGLGHSVNFGKPWIGGSACTHGVVSLPYLDGPDLEWLAEPRVRFLWLIPISHAEVEFKRSHGMEALEERFEAARFNYLDPLRASVVRQ